MKAAALLVIAALAATTLQGAGADPLPTCPKPPGVNDRCEQWERRFTDSRPSSHSISDVPAGMVRARNADRLYVATTTTVDGGDPYQTVAALSASSGVTTWFAHPPTSLPTSAQAIALSPDQSTLVVAGTLTRRESLNSEPMVYAYTVAYAAATGKIRWQALYLLGGEINTPVEVGFSPTGNRVFVVGTSHYTNRQVPYLEWFVLAYASASGKESWHQRYGGPAGGQNFVRGVAVSPDGARVFVTGQSERPTSSPTHYFDWATIAYRTRDGRMLWRDVTHYGEQNEPVDVTVVGNRVVETGTATISGSGASAVFGFVTVALSASTGRTKWQATYRSDTSGQSATASAIARSPGGDRVYVTGSSGSASEVVPGQVGIASRSAATVAYDTASGRRLWVSTYQPSGGYQALSMAVTVTGSGALYVAAAVAPAAGVVDAATTLAYSPSGTLSWVARQDIYDPLGVGTVQPFAVAAAPDGRTVYVAASEQRLVDSAMQPRCQTNLFNNIGCGKASNDLLVLAYAG